MRVFTLILVTLLLTACGDNSKMRSVCLDLAKDSSVDPSSVSINKEEIIPWDMKLSDVYSAISQKYHRNTPAEVTDAVKNLVHEEKSPVAVSTNIDYTSNGNTGKVRSRVSCTFVTGALKRPFLFSVFLNDKNFDIGMLDNLFGTVSRPGGLDEDFYLK